MAVDPRRGIVTPEAVLLEFELAGIGSRVLAILVDLLAQLALFLAVSFVMAGVLSTGVPEVVGVVFVVVALFLVVFGYPIGFETFWNGRSPGKAALGLRVVTVEGAPIRFRHAVIRAALGIVDFLLPPGGLTAVLVTLLSGRNQRLGDLVAGTIVIRERTAVGGLNVMVFNPPPGWEDFTTSLDVAALEPEQYGVVRSFLLRVGQLDVGARVALAERLAPLVARRIRHELVPGTHPELFLVSVAAAYQRRHGGAPPTPTVPHPATAAAAAASAAPPAADEPPTAMPVDVPPPAPPPADFEPPT